MKFLKKLKFFLFFPLLCLLFFFILFFINQFFLIKKVQLISEKKFLLANEDELKNKNLIFINQDEIAKKIIRENSLLKKAIVNKIWPATLKVTVYLYEPMAALIVNQGFFNLSADGRILSKIKEGQPSLPIINYYQKLNRNSFQTGDWIDYKDIQQALFFIDKLGQINLAPLTIDIKGQDMLVFNLDGDKKIIFSNKVEKELQDYQLEYIVRQFKIEGKEFKKIDLRFEKPVIEF
ncbi:MAG: FtsQ-type POTRA domain-containing protein [Candidatus Roizmanbacteria bacterium]|nr:FtsQ-type POTRA domain-containing protein [Candidatus Roizmanbacteria bacterium]